LEDKKLTTRVIIVRHGQSTYNTERRIQGRSDASTLTQKGYEDALKVGAVLSHLTFAAVYTSPLQRAKKTAEVIVGSTSAIQPTDKLSEIDLPLWEGMLLQDVRDKFAADYHCWQQQPDQLVMMLPPEGTIKHFPVLALYEQAGQFWQEILPHHAGETILIIGHNGINRALISTALGISPSRYHAIQQSNCGISVLNFAGGLGQPVQLESLNQTAHLGEFLPSLRPNHQGVRFLLVRHGETDWNRQTRFQGQIDVPLNENGRQQSQKAANFSRCTT
jgi:probable phosphoglycerate mutase